MNNDELKQLALDISDSKVFGSWMLPSEQAESLMSVVFMPLAFGAAETIKDQDVWGIYEYIDKATRQTVNGYPLFMSFKILTKAECSALSSMLEKLRKMKAEFLSNEESVSEIHSVDRPDAQHGLYGPSTTENPEGKG